MPNSPPSPEPRRLLPYGARAVLLECADLDDTRAVHRWLQTDRPAVVTEVIPGARTLLLRLGPPADSGEVRRLTDRLLTLAAGTGEPDAAADRGASPGTPEVVVDVDYDGEDLDHVAGLLGLDPAGVVARHTGQTWTVAFCGFAPGFGYLAGRDDLAVPRRDSPRTRVPAGAVGLADRWSGIYPRSAPGGWQLIGRTDLRVWDLTADPPALLRPGTRVRFRDRAAPHAVPGEPDRPGDRDGA